MRLCLERILPPCRERTINFVLPPIESASDIAATKGRHRDFDLRLQLAEASLEQRRAADRVVGVGSAWHHNR